MENVVFWQIKVPLFNIILAKHGKHIVNTKKWKKKPITLLLSLYWCQYQPPNWTTVAQGSLWSMCPGPIIPGTHFHSSYLLVTETPQDQSSALAFPFLKPLTLLTRHKINIMIRCVPFHGVVFKIAKYFPKMYFLSQCKHIKQPFFVYKEGGSNSWPIVTFRPTNAVYLCELFIVHWRRNNCCPRYTDFIMGIDILENFWCIINLIIISKLLLGPGKNLMDLVI